VYVFVHGQPLNRLAHRTPSPHFNQWHISLHLQPQAYCCLCGHGQPLKRLALHVSSRGGLVRRICQRRGGSSDAAGVSVYVCVYVCVSVSAPVS
jgi:hypothetical protein